MDIKYISKGPTASFVLRGVIRMAVIADFGLILSFAGSCYVMDICILHVIRRPTFHSCKKDQYDVTLPSAPTSVYILPVYSFTAQGGKVNISILAKPPASTHCIYLFSNFYSALPWLGSGRITTMQAIPVNIQD